MAAGFGKAMRIEEGKTRQEVLARLLKDYGRNRLHHWTDQYLFLMVNDLQ